MTPTDVRGCEQRRPKLSPEQDATSQNDGGMSSLVGSTNDLASDTPQSRIYQILQWVPRILSSKPHVIVLMGTHHGRSG